MNTWIPTSMTSAIGRLSFLVSLLMSFGELRASCCCCIAVPEVRFHTNSTEPVDGDLDLRCVSRRMNADSALSDIAMILRDNPTITMLIVGHADSEEADVEALSLQRAQRMACELVSTYGIEAGRLTTEGKGADQPRVDERWLARMSKKARVQGRQINQRVEFKIMSFDWISPHPDAIAAVRFLSDPATSPASATSFCSEPVASIDVLDTEAILGTQDTELIAVEEPVAMSTESPFVKLEALAPMIVPNPIANNELNLVWAPATAQQLSIRLMTLDGRSIMERRTTEVEQGARLNIPIPMSLASGAYVLRINAGSQDWSLRFVKP